MLKKVIKYEDFNGVEQVGEFYFNLTKAELFEMEMNESTLAKEGGITGGLHEKFEIIKSKGSGKEILQAFKDIIFMAYGEKSEDGKFFRKSAEISRNFADSPAYSVMFMELMTTATGAADFANGILPADVSGMDPDKPVGKYPSAPETKVESDTVVAVPEEAPVETATTPTPEQIAEYLKNQGNTPDAV